MLTLVADQVAATPQLPRHGVVTSLTAMHGLDGRHLAQVWHCTVFFLAHGCTTDPYTLYTYYWLVGTRIELQLAIQLLSAISY